MAKTIYLASYHLFLYAPLPKQRWVACVFFILISFYSSPASTYHFGLFTAWESDGYCSTFSLHFSQLIWNNIGSFYFHHRIYLEKYSITIFF